jgi:hypothetical protein
MAADFDTWQANPYTKVLQDSIARDYVPRADALALRSLLVKVYEKACSGEIGVLEAQRTCGGGCYGFWDDIKRAIDGPAGVDLPDGAKR